MSEQQPEMYARGAEATAGYDGGLPVIAEFNRPNAGGGRGDGSGGPGNETPEEIAAIRAALIEAEESGDVRPFDPDEFLREMEAEYAAKHGRISP